MGNHMKGCRCRQCRRGMHTRYDGKLMQKLIRSERRKAGEAPRRGEEPDSCTSRGYTD